MRVAVVDSGIAAGHPHVGDVAEGVSLVEGVSDTLDRMGHGTAVAAVIREKAPGAELVPVKVFHRALTTDARTLALAIRWAAENSCRLINLSLGTANADHAGALESAIAFAAECGALVIAAYESDGTRWLPGSLAGAVAVLGDGAIDRATVSVARSDAGVPRFRASIYPRPIPGVPRDRNLSGVSFAVANVTGVLARLDVEAEWPSHDELGVLLAR